MAKVNKPKDTDLLQQRLKAFQPVHTLESTVSILVGFSILFFVFGFVLYSAAASVIEISTEYTECGNPCVLNITVSGQMTAPIFVYYELKNYYQNHRNYVKSKDYSQLRGKDGLKASDLSKCNNGGLYGRDILNNSQFTHYLNGDPIGPDDILNPCGLMARSVFNDSYSLYTDYEANKSIAISETGIAWESDLTSLFGHVPNYLNKTYIDVTDEHFVVWMRTAVTKSFRKIWGIIQNLEDGENHGSLGPGTYTLEISNNYNVTAWKGKKFIVLSTVNSLGGQNYYLGMIFIFTAIGCLLSSMFFCGRAMISKKGVLTIEQLSW